MMNWRKNLYDDLSVRSIAVRFRSSSRRAGAEMRGRNRTSLSRIHNLEKEALPKSASLRHYSGVSPFPPNSGGTGCTSCCQVLEGRKPKLVLRFAGAFPLRTAERTFDGR